MHLRPDLMFSSRDFLWEVLGKCAPSLLILFFYGCKLNEGNPIHESDHGMLSHSCPKASGNKRWRKPAASACGRDSEMSWNGAVQWLGSCWSKWVVRKKLSVKYPMSQLMGKTSDSVCTTNEGLESYSFKDSLCDF